MKKLLAAGALLGLMSSCGSVLSLNPSYGQATKNAVVETVQEPIATTTTDNSTALLGSLLGTLAGNGSTAANSDGTALTTGGVVSGLLNSVLNTFVTVDQNTIVGTWNFKGSAFVLESENVLASLGSEVVASQMEAKVDQYLAKLKIKEGMCRITFNKDGSFVFTAGERTMGGTYELNSSTKELTMNFGLLTSTAYLVYDAGTINIVYQSDALLNLVKAFGSKGDNATLALLGTLMNQYDGLRIGMAFTK